MTSYRDTLYRRYASEHQEPGLEARDHEDLWSFLGPLLPRQRDVRVLDVGCGTGKLLRLLEKRGYSSTFGIDLSQEQIDVAKSEGTMNVAQADLFEYRAPDGGSYDVVVAIDVVEHFDRDAVIDVFKAFRSLLAPGGTLIIRTPNGTSPFAGRILYSDLTHGVSYTRRSLEQVALAAGFRDVDVRPVRPSGTSPVRLLRRLIWRLYEGFFGLALLAETGRRHQIMTQNCVAAMTVPPTDIQ